jgi:hypothetical protein
MLEINNIRDWNALPGRTPRPQKAAEQIASQVDKVVLGQPSFSTRVRHLRTAMKPDFWQPAPETLALLAFKPEIAATLLGLQPVYHLKQPQRQLEDLHTLAQRVTVIGDQRIALHQTEDGAQMLINVDALARDLNMLGAQTTPKEVHQELWNIMEPGNPVRLFADSIGEAMAPTVSGLQPLETHESSDNQVRQIGMIAYCDTPEEVDKFQNTLKDWEANFQLFGHHDRTIRICDDSPPQHAERIRQACQSHQSGIGTTVQYFGRQEKEALRQQMTERITATPKFEQLGLTRQDIEAMTLGMFGGVGAHGYSSGPTENRNLSTLLLQGTRSFQADHDMVPQVQTMTADRLRSHNGYEMLGSPSAPDLITMPVDLLTQLENEAPANGIFSPQFCGSVDPPIEHIVQSKTYFQDDMLKATSGRRTGMQTGRSVLDAENEGVFRTASPMLLPEKYETFLPLSPTVRDGDLIVGAMMKKQAGIQARELPRSILHTVAAGSQWGGEANLLKDTTLSQTVSYALFDLTDAGIEATADQILRNLIDQPEWLQEKAEKCMEAHWQVAKGYVESRDKRIEALQGLLANPNPKALQEWYAGRPDKTGDPTQACLEMKAEMGQNEREAADMAELKPDQNRVQVLVGKAAQKLRDYALALKFHEEILEVTRQAGGDLKGHRHANSSPRGEKKRGGAP